MPQVGFKHTIPEFERAKTFHALGRAGYCDRLLEFTFFKTVLTHKNLETLLKIVCHPYLQSSHWCHHCINNNGKLKAGYKVRVASVGTVFILLRGFTHDRTHRYNDIARIK
jgi:hypothetical protein